MDDRNHFIAPPKVECILSSECVNHHVARSFLSDFLLQSQLTRPAASFLVHNTTHVLSSSSSSSSSFSKVINQNTTIHTDIDEFAVELNVSSNPHDHHDMWEASVMSTYKEETMARLTGILYAMTPNSFTNHKNNTRNQGKLHSHHLKKEFKHSSHPIDSNSFIVGCLNEDEYEDEEEEEPTQEIGILDEDLNHNGKKKKEKKHKKKKRKVEKEKKLIPF